MKRIILLICLASIAAWSWADTYTQIGIGTDMGVNVANPGSTMIPPGRGGFAVPFSMMFGDDQFRIGFGVEPVVCVQRSTSAITSDQAIYFDLSLLGAVPIATDSGTHSINFGIAMNKTIGTVENYQASTVIDGESGMTLDVPPGVRTDWLNALFVSNFGIIVGYQFHAKVGQIALGPYINTRVHFLPVVGVSGGGVQTSDLLRFSAGVSILF